MYDTSLSLDPTSKLASSGSGPSPSEIQDLMQPLEDLNIDAIRLAMDASRTAGTARRVRESDHGHDNSPSGKKVRDESDLSHSFITSDNVLPRSDDIPAFSDDSIFMHDEKASQPRQTKQQTEEERLCTKCKRTMVHTIEFYSIHCKMPPIKKPSKSSYQLITCKGCRTQSSPCPNTTDAKHSGNFRHENEYLIWKQIKATKTQRKIMNDPTEMLWEIECPLCIEERKRRETDSTKKPLTRKWTRCNHCNALYKKGKGKDALHTRQVCKVLNPSSSARKMAKKKPKCQAPTHSPSHASAYAVAASAQSTSPASPASIKLVEGLLQNGEFRRFPKELRMQIVQQCGLDNFHEANLMSWPYTQSNL